MKRLPLLLLLVIAAALCVPLGAARAALTDYTFTASTGTYTPISGTELASASYGYSGDGYYGDAAIRGPLSIGFTFMFNCREYTTFGVNVHGNMVLGAGSVNQPYNYLNSSSQYPILAPFWDYQWLYGYCGTNNIKTQTTGTAGSRVLTVEWNTQLYGWCGAYYSYQVKLYEGSNRIEFRYGSMYQYVNTSASCGISASSSDYMSVTSGYSPSMSRTYANNYIDTYYNPFPYGTIYTFDGPGGVSYNGNVAQGGAANMASGATLMSNISLERGASQTYQPFSVVSPASICSGSTLSFTISGAAAGDYSVSPTFVTLSPSTTLPINITFTPQAIGVRNATLTVRDQSGSTRVYPLSATGTPRISWTPDLAQGGTVGLVNGDTLLKDIIVQRRVARDFTPMTITNFSTNGSIPPASVTAVIDSAGGISTQYRIVGPASAQLGPGESYTPVVEFFGTGLNAQHATLTINADGEIRSFPLKAISGAPAITVTAFGGSVDPANPIFHQVFSCVGEYASTIPLQVSNPGQFPLVITSIELYGTDTTERQGVPTFPLLRDAQGRAMPIADYVISRSPGTAPLATNTPAALPITVNPGTSTTLYATLVGQIPGKRFGRVVMRTNGENIMGTDTTLGGDPSSVMGLLSFDLVGRSIGSQLAADAAALPLKTVSFPGTRVGDTTVTSFTIANTGACDLRINSSKLRIYSGDVNEFRMLTSLRNARFDAATNDYVLAPGQVDTIVVRFTPSRGGTRMATLWLQTNDSTLSKPGLAERGSYYLDLTGRGLAGLEARDLVLDPVVIGGFVDGVAVLENTLNTTVGVSSITFVGDDAAQFGESAIASWPSLPANVLPGEKLRLGVRLTPVGDVGLRRTTMVLVTTTGDTVRVAVRGEAGSQGLVVSPTSLFSGVEIAVGQDKRQTVMIANTGTLPVRITDLAITGPDAASYRMGPMPRRDLDAGQTEYLEITFAPTTAGQTSAELVITANTGQSYSVLLGGSGLKIRRDPIDPARTAGPNAEGSPDTLENGARTGTQVPVLR